MPLFQAIALIKSLDSEIKSVEFLYNEQVSYFYQNIELNS